MTELEKMKMGEWYDANHDPEIIKQRYTAFDLCFELNQILEQEQDQFLDIKHVMI